MSEEVRSILIDQQDRLHSAIDKLGDILTGFKDHQHQSDLILAELTNQVKQMREAQQACSAERQKNSNLLNEQAIRRDERNGLSKMLGSALWAITLILIGIILRSTVPELIKPVPPVKKVYPRKPYNIEQLKPIPSTAAIPFNSCSKEG